ncbi:MAG: Dabb family protein [Phycisphaeraceae bacterium]|nr:Dabb family protein [Phycisphaeraceae bacterium]
MIEHMVWIKFRPAITPQRIDEHLRNLAGLKNTVPGIVSLRVGPNFTDRANGYTHGLIVSFASRRDLETYLPHPNHVKVAAPLKQDADLLAMDIECA